MSEKKNQNPWVVAITVAVLVLVCAGGAWDSGMFDGSGSTITVPKLSSSDGEALARKLDEAYDAQGVCYGWRFKGSGSSSYSGVNEDVGSNFGDGRALDGAGAAAECRKSVELVVFVSYTSSSSELDDYATVSVKDDDVDLPYDVYADLERFGVTEKALIDDPVGAVARGVLALPLLVAEYGLADPLPPPSGAATATAAAPTVGSDLLRDRGWLLLTVAILLAFTAVAVVFGLRSRRRKDSETAMAAAEAVRRATRAAAARRQRAERNVTTKPPTPDGAAVETTPAHDLKAEA